MLRDVSELFMARATLCDLLIGRWMRALAQEKLADALMIEEGGWHKEALERLDAAAHLEWIGARAEQGQILWGGRLNRYGERPETVAAA